MYKLLFTFLLVTFGLTKTFAQNIDLDKYDIYLNDTLISKSDFIKNGNQLSQDRLKGLVFKPITDGKKKAYYLNGQLYSIGEIKNSKENGFWKFWYSNGVEAREGDFINGNPDGTQKYWYKNGQLRGIGHWKDGVYDGEWIMFSEDGKQKVIQEYKNGKLIKSEKIDLNKNSENLTK
jgi:antitoxin component YwqK of YwqJK toxin-antitoxin module